MLAGVGGWDDIRMDEVCLCRLPYPRVVNDVALLANKVRLPSTSPLSCVTDG